MDVLPASRQQDRVSTQAGLALQRHQWNLQKDLPWLQQVIAIVTLGLNPGDSFFFSVATVHDQGHESLFAYKL